MECGGASTVAGADWSMSPVPGTFLNTSSANGRSRLRMPVRRRVLDRCWPDACSWAKTSSGVLPSGRRVIGSSARPSPFMST